MSKYCQTWKLDRLGRFLSSSSETLKLTCNRKINKSMNKSSYSREQHAGDWKTFWKIISVSWIMRLKGRVVRVEKSFGDIKRSDEILYFDPRFLRDGRYISRGSACGPGGRARERETRDSSTRTALTNTRGYARSFAHYRRSGKTSWRSSIDIYSSCWRARKKDRARENKLRRNDYVKDRMAERVAKGSDTFYISPPRLLLRLLQLQLVVRSLLISSSFSFPSYI